MIRAAVILLGPGGVGRALLRQIVEGRDVHARRLDCRFELVAVVDSNGCLQVPEGLNDEQIAAVIKSKAQGEPLNAPRPTASELLATAAPEYPMRLLVDVTASDGLIPLIDQALSEKYGVVLANKKPLSGPWNLSSPLFNEPRLRFESTVAGGQPVLQALRYLLDTGDQIRSIQGQLSGTMGYVCRRMDEGLPFSKALLKAQEEGITEPDPREDLFGRDVMRKLVILGRLAGWSTEAEDILVESLVPPALTHISAEKFSHSLEAVDTSFNEWAQATARKDMVLRYIAQVNREGGSVGLKAVPLGSAAAALKHIAVFTDRYEVHPLVIGSDTSGTETTAAGVLGDMAALVREHRPSSHKS